MPYILPLLLTYPAAMSLLILIQLALHLEDDLHDRELALRIKQSDRSAFRLFFERYKDSLLSFLISKGTPKDDAEDLLQSAFLIIWEKREEIRPDRSLRSFLYTIAYNRMLNLFRDRKKQDPEYAYKLHDSGSNPEVDAANRQALEAMQKALDVMPEKRRRVFELCYLQGLSHKEAAQALDVAQKTIENHMALALKELRAALKHFMPSD
jgi:RNA polymerase sigma-70 factor, ECF subfamily